MLAENNVYQSRTGASYRLTEKGANTINRFRYALQKVDNHNLPSADEIFTSVLFRAERQGALDNGGFLTHSWRNQNGTSFPLMLMLGSDIEKVERTQDKEREDFDLDL